MAVVVTVTAVFVVVLLVAVAIVFLVAVLLVADLAALVTLVEVFVTPDTLFAVVIVALFVAVTERDEDICLFAVSFTCLSVTSFVSRAIPTLLRAVAGAMVPIVRGLVVVVVPFTAPGFGRGEVVTVVLLVTDVTCFVVAVLVAAGAVAGRLGGFAAAAAVVVVPGFLIAAGLVDSPLVITADLEVVVVPVGLGREDAVVGLVVDVVLVVEVTVLDVSVVPVVDLGLAVGVAGDFVTLLVKVLVVDVVVKGPFFGVEVRTVVDKGFVGEVGVDF